MHNMMNTGWFGKALTVAGIFDEFDMTGHFAQEMHGYIDEVSKAFVAELVQAIGLAGAIELEAQGCFIIPIINTAVEAKAPVEVEARKAA